MANIVKSVLNGMRKAVQAFRKGDGIGLAWNMFIREVWPDLDKRASIEEGYADNTALFSIVNTDAEKFASIPRYIYDANSKNAQGHYNKRLIDGTNVKALSKLLDKPNPNYSRSEFDELLRIFYNCTGDGFIWLNRGDVAREYIAPTVMSDGTILTEGYFRDRTDEEVDRLPVMEMYVLPSGWVGVIPDPNNAFAIKAYWMEINGKKIVLRRNDVIHWKKTNPVFDPTTGTHLRGINPFQVGRHTIQQNKDAVAAMDRMFKNDGAKGVLVNENLRWETMDPKQKQDIRDMVDKRINNAEEVKGAVATLGGKWNYLNIAKDSVDEKLLEGEKFTMQKLCFLIGPPYELFDSTTTYANKEQAQKGWVSNKIIPARTNVDQKFTERLAPAFGLVDKEGTPTVVIWSDFSQLPELKRDVAALITAFQNAWYIPPNQKLIELGYDPLPDALFNEPWIPAGVMPLSDVKETIKFNQQAVKTEEDEIEY
jgi:phage portal protein BeeE